MDTIEDSFESLSKNIDEYEKKSRRRLWISSVIPLVLGLLLLGYTVWQIRVYGKELTIVQKELGNTTQQLSTANDALQGTSKQLDQAKADLISVQGRLDSTTAELEKIREELDNTKDELDKTKKELDEATQALRNANVFLANSVTLDIVEEKGAPFQAGYPYQAALLTEIQNLQLSGVGWNSNGFSIDEGFNSPNFAVYVMQTQGLISNDYGTDAKPWQFLTPVDEPSMGDIVYYEGGYAMFYFVVKEQEFVIGMTPLGIISQKLDFAPIIGYLSVPYQ